MKYEDICLKDLWMELFTENLPILLADVPSTLNNVDTEKVIPTEVRRQLILDRVVIAAEVSDVAIREISFRFWNGDDMIDSMDKIIKGGLGRGKGQEGKERSGKRGVPGRPSPR